MSPCRVQPLIFVENVASANGVVRGLQAGLAAVQRATGWGAAPDKDSLRDVQVSRQEPHGRPP